MPHSTASQPPAQETAWLPAAGSVRPMWLLARLPPEMTPARAVACVLSLLILLGPCFAQENTPVFKSDSSLVRVDTAALTSAGTIITDLHKTDLRVFDNGAEQNIQGFTFEEEPLDLILLFDASGGMRGKLLQLVRAVELGFHELKNGDRVCVMGYQRDVTEIAPFTTDLDAVNQTILLQVLGLHFGGAPQTGPAVEAAARRFRKEPTAGRSRAVLAITDKIGARSDVAVRELWKSNAVFSELVIGNSDQTQIRDRDGSLTGTQTGGATVVAGPPGPSFQQAIRLLRRRYTLYYSAPAAQTGTQREIDVRLSPAASLRFPAAQLRFRRGYLVP